MSPPLSAAMVMALSVLASGPKLRTRFSSELGFDLERLGFVENLSGTLRITKAGLDAWQKQGKA